MPECRDQMVGLKASFTNIGNNTEIGLKIGTLPNPLQNKREKPTNMKSVSKPIPNFDGISVFSHSHRQCFPVTDLTSYATCRAQAASPTTSAANQNLVPRP